MFVKICGIANREDALAVAKLAPDALGFIFWPDSPRGVTADQVAAWTPLLPSSISKVGVFVSPTPAEVTRTVHHAGLDVVQLHQVALGVLLEGQRTGAVALVAPAVEPGLHQRVEGVGA